MGLDITHLGVISVYLAFTARGLEVGIGNLEITANREGKVWERSYTPANICRSKQDEDLAQGFEKNLVGKPGHYGVKKVSQTIEKKERKK